MSKSMLITFILMQHKALSAKDNKERLRFTVAGIRDGKFYDKVGTDYGVFDTDCKDTEFIPDSDFELSRITGSKIAVIHAKVVKFFDAYYNKESAGTSNDEANSKGVVDAELKPDETPDIDIVAVENACKKAIKKGNFEKAEKLIDKLDDKVAKKLRKKLDKAKS